MWAGKSRSELRVGQACHMRWATYGMPCNCGQAVNYPRWEPYAGKPHVPALCGGRIVICVPTAIRISVCCYRMRTRL